MGNTHVHLIFRGPDTFHKTFFLLSGVLLISGYSGCLAWKASQLKNDSSRSHPELVGKSIVGMILLIALALKKVGIINLALS